jgi:hypothetical protein
MMPDQPMTVEEIERKVLVLWASCWPHDPEEFKSGVAELAPEPNYVAGVMAAIGFIKAELVKAGGNPDPNIEPTLDQLRAMAERDHQRAMGVTRKQ